MGKVNLASFQWMNYAREYDTCTGDINIKSVFRLIFLRCPLKSTFGPVFSKAEQGVNHALVKHKWWRHQMETFSASLSLCEENHRWIPLTKTMTRSFYVFLDLRLNKCCAKNRDAADLRCYRARYDVVVLRWENGPVLIHTPQDLLATPIYPYKLRVGRYQQN